MNIIHKRRKNKRGYSIKIIDIDNIQITTGLSTYMDTSEILIKHKDWINKQLAKLTLSNIIQIDENVDDNQIYSYFSGYIKNIVDLDKSFSKYNSLKIGKYKSKWGSCDRFGNIKLNKLLYFLDKRFQQYVIIHELCHMLEFNHSKSFWKEVMLRCENYKILKKEIKKYKL